jgi:hypothetical protein
MVTQQLGSTVLRVRTTRQNKDLLHFILFYFTLIESLIARAIVVG